VIDRVPLVSRLRDANAQEYYKPKLLLEAADEIERLRSGLERIATRNFFNDKPPDQAMQNIALATLNNAGLG
jgi:hypothetical protein